MTNVHFVAAGLLFLVAIQGAAATKEVDPLSHQQFADELTSILYTKPNECTSALGVSMAFSLIYPGCTGAGIEQLRDVLGYPESTNLQLIWNETTQDMLNNAQGQCLSEWDGVCESQAPLLQIANSIWLDDGDTLNSAYASVVGQYAIQTDFTANGSQTILNEWVENSTNGLIDSIVPKDKPLSPPYVLIAINSIYLKASWRDQFEKRMTNLDTFYDSVSRNTEVSQAHFMHIVEYYSYSNEALLGYQVIDLPFDNSQMSMIFVLPMRDDIEPVLSSELLPVLNDLKPTRIALSLPKFKFESEYDDTLKSTLIQLGIVDPFMGGALCGIFENDIGCEALIIDKVIQKTVIDVNEEGVEAAAVTAIMMVESSGEINPAEPVLMMLDHPFQFFIYDKSEDLVLFEGRVGTPEVPENDPGVPLLDAMHSESDFWSKTFYVSPTDVAAQQPSISCANVRCADPCFDAVCGTDETCAICTDNEDEGCIGTCIVGGEVCGGYYKCVPSIQSGDSGVTSTIGGSSISQPSITPGDTLPQSDNASSSDRTTSKRFYRISTITFLAFALGCAS